MLGVVHPFPSTLDAAIVAAIAAVAGAPAAMVAVLGFAMLLLQFAIGAANDWADAPADATANPAKPIPAGVIRRRTVARLAGLLGVAGLGLAWSAGSVAFTVAVAGLAVGLAYDLRLKGTRWSWVPYAIGIPLLPVFAWGGATGGLPGPFLVLVPLAAVAGAALAVANALADLERDRAAGTETVATSLGAAGARRIGAALMLIAVAAAVASAVALGGPSGWVAVVVAGGILALGGVLVGWGGSPRARQRAWELQGLAAGIMATGWVGAVAAGGALA